MASLTALLYVGGAAYTHFEWPGIAPQFTPNGPLDQKMLFLKQMWPQETPSTAVIGSSMALNNFDSDDYQDSTQKPAINFGANGLSLYEAWKFYQNGKSSFPVGDVILVAQFNELRDAERKSFLVSPAVFARYVRGRIGWLEEFTYRDLQGFLYMAENQSALLLNRTNYTSSDFTVTGAVPLSIYGPGINVAAWNAVGLSEDTGCQHCGATLSAICQEAVHGGHDFTLIMPPLNPHIRATRPDIEARYQRGRRIMTSVTAACGGRFFDVGASATFDQRCFADFEHLNAVGMRGLTDLFVAWRRNGAVPSGARVDCASVPDAGPPSGPAGAPS